MLRLVVFLSVVAVALAYPRRYCEFTDASVSCPSGTKIDIVSAEYGRKNTRICTHKGATQVDSKHLSNTGCSLGSQAKSKVRAACQNKSSCKFKVNNGFFGRDPCHNTFKYLDIKYNCKKSVTLQHKRVCEFSHAQIRCPRGEKIYVTGAVYGRKSRTTCPYKGKQRVDSKHLKNTRCDLGPLAKYKVQVACNYRSSCKFKVDNGFFGRDPCYNTFKYLDIYYICQNPGGKPSPPKLEPKYVGCYIDKRSRDLNGKKYLNSSKMTIKKCARYCKGYKYMGVQYSTECYCDNKIGKYGKDKKGKKCNMKCKGAKRQTCGGRWRNSVYKL